MFDLNHRYLSGEYTKSFLVQFADTNGRLGYRHEVGGRRAHVKKVFSGVSDSTDGFRISATSNDALFIDSIEVEAQGGVLNSLAFEQDNHDGYCLGEDARRFKYGGKCWGAKIFRCIDFCANGDVSAVVDGDCMGSSIRCTTFKYEDPKVLQDIK